MVSKVSHAGFRDWLAQRVTAIIIGAYAVFILSYLATYQPVYFAQWFRLFHHPAMKVATFITLLSITWHAWIGLWTVFTDYVKPRAVRLFLEVIVAIVLVGYLAWLLEIMWGPASPM